MQSNNIYLTNSINLLLQHKTQALIIETNNISEDILLPFLFNTLNKNNVKPFNLQIKKELTTENLEDKGCLLIINRFNLLSRDLRLQFILKDRKITFNTFEKYFKQKKDLNEKDLNEKNLNEKETFFLNIASKTADKKKIIQVPKDLKVILICNTRSQILSKQKLEVLENHGLVKIIKIYSLENESQLFFYKDQTIFE